jgi:hypothetical protein
MVVILGFLFFLPSAVQAHPKIPERFVYYIFWSGVRAGMATLITKHSSEGISIQSRATSASFISLFYKVDDITQSTLYPDRYPKRYMLKLREGRHRRNKSTQFGITSGNGSQKVIYRNILDKKTLEFDLAGKAFDPLSAFYEIRHRELTVGKSQFLNVFDSKKLWTVEVKVLRKEKIALPSGDFDTVVISPVLQSEGIFLKKGKFHIWLTDDDRKIPVMVKSKVTIGHFTAKLIEGTY